jgi:hypothetical protein
MTHKRLIVALVAVVGMLAALGVGAAFSKAGLASPTITSAPAATTTSPTATFAFTGPSGATFKCGLDAPATVACASPRTYTSLADGAHVFNVVSVKSGETSATTGFSWTVVPPAPTLTAKPPNPTSNATNDFAWTNNESGLSSECSLENGIWFSCNSPYRWVIGTTNYGQHQFAVRSRDAAGNVSTAKKYTFKFEKGLASSGVPFQITGSVSGLVLGVWQSIAVTVTSTNSVPIYVSSLHVTATSNTTGCGLENLELVQSNLSSSNTLIVPANGSLVVPAQAAPRIRLIDMPTVNQDACKRARFALSYTGTATN